MKSETHNLFIQVRCTPEDKTLTERASSAAGMTLSAWFRDRMRRIAEAELATPPQRKTKAKR